MFNRLYLKLAASLVLLFVIIGTVLLLLTRNAMERYYQEITQRLNADVAMYVTDELELIADGKANPEAVKALAHHAMIINPAIEVFLLNPQGEVISHAIDDQQIKQPNVSLQPVKAFLKGSSMPLVGDNPRIPGDEKIFSASPVTRNGKLEGYVYIVLEGAKREQLAASIMNSEVFRVSSAAVIACLVFGLISALLIFSRMSKRLETLTAKADHFYQNDLIATQPSPSLDEIDRLSEAFDAMQTRIDQQIGQIKQSDKMRRELITNISHDLRTPLTSMQGYIETALLKQEELSPQELKNYLEITRNRSQHLGRLIADLFELTKLDSNVVKPQLEAFSIAELIQDIVQGYQLKANQNRITLNLEGDLDNASVFADIRLMERVINNLLDNALRHTPNQGSITISLKNKTNGVEVQVSDTGAGIAADDLPYIFDRFYHVKNSEQEELKSTGLGLAIVKRILDLHFSNITVKSTVKKGTCFCFVLPQREPLAA